MNNRVVCFDIKDLGTTLRKAGMLIVQNMVWTRVSTNRACEESHRYYVDEFHLLLKKATDSQLLCGNLEAFPANGAAFLPD